MNNGWLIRRPPVRSTAFRRFEDRLKPGLRTETLNRRLFRERATPYNGE
jgi:hypothetical protein